jgi:hypothetical protein
MPLLTTADRLPLLRRLFLLLLVVMMVTVLCLSLMLAG